MRFKPFFLTIATALAIAASSLVAFAQVTQASGKVTLKQSDGTEAPVAGAQIDIYRTDIKWETHLKTGKDGKWTHAGIPFVGTYTVIVSAPGARPTYATDIKFSRTPTYDFSLNPGDGSKLTLDQIKGMAAAGGNKAAGGGATVSVEDKKKADEAAKAAAEENKRITEHNEKVQNLNDLVKSGNEAFAAKKYDEAIGFYDQGIQAAPQEPVFYQNKAVVLRARAVEQYNAALTDKSKREVAKEGFKASVENMEKAITLLHETQSKNTTQGGTASAAAGDELKYLSDRQESYRLALQTSTPVDAEAAVKAFQEYINAEIDPAKKMKAQASLGDSLFYSGKIDEAIATYRQVLSASPDNLDAMYGLGLALAAKVTDATKDTALITEAREMLEKFISKAPDTHPRKQDAVASVQYLNETMKGAAASKSTDKSGDKSKTGRRKP
jgi:tetratricopeptide (TPR) repeat protein